MNKLPLQRGKWMSAAVNWRWRLVPEKQCHLTAGLFLGGGGQAMCGQLPSFMLIKDMPNYIEGIFGTLINKMIVIDEVCLALCLGPMATEEGFINTYACHPPACVYKSESETVCEREREAQVMYLFTCLVPGLCLFLCDCVSYPSFYNWFLPEVSLRSLIYKVLMMFENYFPCSSTPRIVPPRHLVLIMCIRWGFTPSGITAAGWINVTH